jgi:tetratricopeptide (TPR) repeat protein
VFAAARAGEPAAGRALADLVRDSGTPDIVRATALVELGPYIAPATIDAVAQGLSDDDPIIRVAAVQALEFVPADIRTQFAVVGLDDPVRAVRIEAARILAPDRPGELSADRQALLDKGLQEYIEAQQVMAERPEAQTSLGNLYAESGETGNAVAAYRTAMELDPAYIPAYVNLADLYRSRGDEAAAEAMLHQAAVIVPDSGDVQHALGLSLARQKRTGEAIESLEQAAVLSPDNARYVYVYAVALNSAGKSEQALMILQGAQNRFPNNTDILAALVAFHRDTGNSTAARAYAEKLRAISH